VSLALVTGGAGFIGSHVVDELLENGWRVRVLDDLSSGSLENLAAVADQIEFVRGDVCDDDAVDAGVAGVDVIFHQAAIASVPRSIAEPSRTDRVNLGGTLRVLEAARRRGCRRFVFASSSAVYGDRSEPPVHESSEPQPLSPYAVQKLAAECHLAVYSRLHGVEAVALRYFNVHGDRQDPESEYAAVIPIFLDAARSGRPLCVHGDGRQTRDFVHVSDVARANRLAAEVPDVSGRCFNVASGQGTSVSELVEVLQDVFDRPLEVVHEPSRAGDVRQSRADVEAARKELGFESSVDLETGIRRTIHEISEVQR
jgi:nucleoside-diphosphate-sugar epimerase